MTVKVTPYDKYTLWVPRVEGGGGTDTLDFFFHAKALEVKLSWEK